MAKPVFYGGQAVIEGVMMRGPRHVAVAVRRESGEIDTVVREAQPWLTAHPAFNKVFLRGVFALVDSLRVGVWGLRWSASRALLDAKPADAAAPKAVEGDPAIKGTMGIGLLIGVALFIVLPTVLAGALRHTTNPWTLNLVETVVRLALFFGYIGLIGFIPGIRRVFQFHGAEHRTINAWEAHAPLTAQSCGQFSVVHPRCGTSFIMFVLILASVVYAFLGWHTPLVRLAIRLGTLPIVAGAAYELLRLAGTLRGSAVMAVVTWPGRFTQRFTTREPDDSQTEVAIAALNAVFDAEREGERSLA
ncbi:MAG TPA: DUF1385 domain-containing protein [Armatimonadota bacterium]|jgi:uncharacterized protein YqhQ